MRSFFLSALVFTGLMVSSISVSAQRVTPAAPVDASRSASSRLALAAATEAAPAQVEAPRLACSKIDGQVLGLNGKPLVGATVTLKGTQHLYITNSEGRYLVEVPVYQGQILEVEAVGYTSREVSLTDCNAPVIGLELAAGTRIKKNERIIES
jgi:hypothetical protein